MLDGTDELTDKTDKRIDRRTPNRYIDLAAHYASSVNNMCGGATECVDEVSATSVDLDALGARLALDVAAPVVLAVAAVLDVELARRVAASAAHRPTAV